MANLQVKNVPEALHRKIRDLATRQGRTIRDLVLEAVRREVAREQFQERLTRRRPVEVGRPAAESLNEARSERAWELGG